VGGTKTDLAVVSAATGAREQLARRRYPSSAYPGLAEMALAFLSEVGLEVDAACFDVAGPVMNGTAQLTNLDWDLDQVTLAAALGVDHAWLLNDLVATASAIPLLRPPELHRVKKGEADPGGAIAVLAPGTGLGEAFLTVENGAYRAHPSEGGHAAFAPTRDVEVQLLRGLWERFDHVSVERVASGVGIPNIYDCLRDRQDVAESAELAARLATTPDRARPILEAALDPTRPDPLAQATVTLFLGILGTEAANLTLKVLGTGGLYLAGGIALALRRGLRTQPFLEAFTDAGRFKPLMERVPIHVVRGNVALLGAASEGLRLLATTTA
jgi:glucokinase